MYLNGLAGAAETQAIGQILAAKFPQYAGQINVLTGQPAQPPAPAPAPQKTITQIASENKTMIGLGIALALGIGLAFAARRR